jgi:hypothetical protein
MVWKIVRRILALFIRIFVWHPVVGLITVVLALGALGLALGGMNDPQALGRQATTQPAAPATSTTANTQPGGPVPVQSAAQTSPSPSLDEYIKGMTTFDAKLMWDALDASAVQSMTTQGGSEQALQQQLDDRKQTGARYDDVTFIGGYSLNNGDRYYFYVVSRRGFAGPGLADQVFFVFTVGKDGKIVKIE